jgi:hypothetical protein
MPISDDKQIIFIHVPKCAGTSMTAAFQSSRLNLRLIGNIPNDDRARYGITCTRWWHHLPAIELMRINPDTEWSKYFKFAFVRNPWDRMVSVYFDQQKRTKESDYYRKHNPKVVEIFKSSPSFVEWVDSGFYSMRPQVDYILDSKQNVFVDFIGRFEKLKEDFEGICRRIGISVELPHKNKTDHEFYRTYYTAETREIVRRKFHADIELLGYSF